MSDTMLHSDCRSFCRLCSSTPSCSPSSPCDRPRLRCEPPPALPPAPAFRPDTVLARAACAVRESLFDATRLFRVSVTVLTLSTTVESTPVCLSASDPSSAACSHTTPRSLRRRACSCASVSTLFSLSSSSAITPPTCLPSRSCSASPFPDASRTCVVSRCTMSCAPTGVAPSPAGSCRISYKPCSASASERCRLLTMSRYSSRSSWCAASTTARRRDISSSSGAACCAAAVAGGVVAAAAAVAVVAPSNATGGSMRGCRAASPPPPPPMPAARISSRTISCTRVASWSRLGACTPAGDACRCGGVDAPRCAGGGRLPRAPRSLSREARRRVSSALSRSRMPNIAAAVRVCVCGWVCVGGMVCGVARTRACSRLCHPSPMKYRYC
eukprot:Rhum_TRINITY_DN14261_c9_g1::Rhum_TRINITY_DN14261_c9_g1_i1::g.77616::m.77616